MHHGACETWGASARSTHTVNDEKRFDLSRLEPAIMPSTMAADHKAKRYQRPLELLGVLNSSALRCDAAHTHTRGE